MATFTSSLEAIGAWRSTRLPLARFVPLALLLAWAACGSAFGTVRGMATVLAAFGLVAQCRLWDDLVDRDHDRASHPDRVLVRAAVLDPFRRAAVVLTMANMLALALLNGGLHALGAAVLFAVLAGWYRWHGSRGPRHAAFLLLKYPAFVLLLAPPDTWPMSAAALVYGAMCAFEWLDTSSGRLHSSARYLPFLCAALALLLMNLGEPG